MMVRFFFRILIFLGGIALLCKSCAPYKKREKQVEAIKSVDFAQQISAAFEDPSFSPGEWPTRDWWLLFGDEQLSAMIQKAIASNPDLGAAISRVQAAYERGKKSKAPLLPQLHGGFSNNYQHLSRDELVRFPPATTPAVVNELNLALNFDYEIDLFGKNRHQYRATMGRARAEAAEMSQALLMITTALTRAYINYSSHLLQLQLSCNLVALQEEYLELVEGRRGAEIENALAVDRASALLIDRKKQRLDYEQKVVTEATQLKILMGLSPTDPLEISPPSLSFHRPFPLPESLSIHLLARRPDIQAQMWQVQASSHLVKSAQASFFPSVNLKAFVGLQSLKWSNLFSIHSFAGSIQPALTLPLFTGGRLTAELEEEYAKYDADVHTYNSLVLKGAKEVVDQIHILKITTQEGELAAQRVAKLLHISSLKEARYAEGIDNYLEMLEGQIAAAEGGMQELDAQNRRYLSVLMLMKSLGGGYGE